MFVWSICFLICWGLIYLIVRDDPLYPESHIPFAGFVSFIVTALILTFWKIFITLAKVHAIV